MKKKKKQAEGFISTEIKRNRNINDDTKKTFAFLIILIIVGLFVVLLYFLNGNYVTKDLKEEETTKAAEPAIDDTQIILDSVFTKGKNYYVLFFDPKDKITGELYDSLSDSYSNDDLPLYVVDLSIKMNSSCYNKDGKENTEPKSVENIVITRPTLMHIKGGKVIKYITERDNIIELLKEKND